MTTEKVFTLTQSELDALIGERLNKDRRSLRSRQAAALLRERDALAIEVARLRGLLRKWTGEDHSDTQTRTGANHEQGEQP